MNNFNWLYIFLADHLILLFFLAAVLLWFVHSQLPLFRGFVASFLAGITASVIKNYYFLPRPFILHGRLPLVDLLMDGSFPSSHTAVSFALGFTVFLWNRRWGLVFIVIALLIASGRVLAGVHTLLDLVGGILLAALCVFLVNYFFHRFKKVNLRD